MTVRTAFLLAALAACAPTGSPDRFAPRVIDVRLDPAFATVDATFEAHATAYDPLGEAVEVDLVWEVDGEVVQRGPSTLAGAFAKGDRVRVVATPRAGERAGEPVASAAVPVQNTPPPTPGMVIDPPIARAWLHDLVCRPFEEPVDRDGDALSWSFAWTADGVPVPSGLGTTTHPGDTVPAALLQEGQVWRCRAELSDGEAHVAPQVAARTIELGVRPLRGVPVAGGSFTCVLDADDHARCWGEEGTIGVSSAPQGERYARVFAGARVACGLRQSDLGLTCWGDPRSPLLAPPPGRWSEVSLGVDTACGLRDDGTIACWGQADDPVLQPPPGWHRDVAVGQSTACAIDALGHAACWGAALGSAVKLPTEATLTQVAVGWDHACGVTPEAGLVCWGANGQGQSAPPRGRFLAVAVRAFETCALRDDGDVVCFGEVDLDVPISGTSLSMAFGMHACARTTTGSIACVPTFDEADRLGGFGEDVPPVEPWTTVDVGDGVTCGLDAAGRADCFGVYGAVDMPTVPLDRVAAGTDAACGLRASDGRAVCWGLLDGTGLTEIPDEPFVELGVGNSLACGLRADGEVRCWGDFAGPVPEGPFQAVHVADVAVCGHRVDGRVDCWNTTGPRTWTPTGQVLSMDLDVLQGCAVLADRSVTCWGSGNPPADDPGPFVQVSVAANNACGLTRGGSARCWGRMNSGASVEAPQVTDLVAVEGGWEHQCALDASGGLWCWGGLFRAPLTLP